MLEAWGGPVRVLRALTATLLAVALATAGHALGGGGVPAGAVLVLGVALLPVALLATRWQWSPVRALLALGSGQVLVHGLLTLMAPGVPGTMVGTHRGHTLTDLVALAGVHGSGPGHTMAASGASTPSMLLSHALMTVVSAWLIAHGEAALWTVLARLVPSLAQPRTPRVSATPAATARAVGSPPALWHIGPAADRGPPALAAS